MSISGSAPPAPSQRRDLVLDAWRGVSVSMVVAAHLAARSLPEGSTLRAVLESAGALGVKFFFVISGFIITKLLLLEHQERGRIALASFYVRRLFRILPPFAVFLIALLLCEAGGLIADAGPMLGAWTFLCNTAWVECRWFVAHFWSLAIEEQFYLAWPPLLASLLALGHVRAVRRAPALAMVVLLGLAQLSLWTIGWINNGLSFACIAAGAWCACNPELKQRIERTASPVVMLVCATALLGRPLIPLLLPGQFRLQDILTPVLLCVVLFGSSRYRVRLEQSRAVRGLASVGLISYSLYLWQQLFLGPAELYSASWLASLWPLCAGAATLSYLWVERPMIRAGRAVSRVLAGRRAAAAGSMS